jgi:hypothetical protein
MSYAMPSGLFLARLRGASKQASNVSLSEGIQMSIASRLSTDTAFIQDLITSIKRGRDQGSEVPEKGRLEGKAGPMTCSPLHVLSM